MTFPNVADLSSAQAPPNGSGFDAAAYAASGRKAVIIKSTESTNYHFDTGDTWELQALQHGLVVGRYHWCGSSTKGTIAAPNVEGDWFLKWNGEHTPGRFAAGDMEDPLPGHGPPLYGMSAASAAAWLDEFLDYIATKGGWPGLGYSFSGSGVVQRIRHAKWPASYPKLTITGAALHQFSSSAPVPGVGNCDDSHCFIDLRAFADGANPLSKEENMTSFIYTGQLHAVLVDANGQLRHFWADPNKGWHSEIRSSGNAPGATVAAETGFAGQLHFLTPRPDGTMQHDWYDGKNWGSEVVK